MRRFEVVEDAFRRSTGEIKLPTRGSKNSAGYDFYSPVGIVIPPHESALIWSDVKAHMYYDNVLMIATRSSMGKQPVTIAQAVGLIDADYYDNESTGGNIGIRLYNAGNTPYVVNVGDRIAQGVFLKYGTVKDDNTTAERKGGFGSTGAN